MSSFYLSNFNMLLNAAFFSCEQKCFHKHIFPSVLCSLRLTPFRKGRFVSEGIVRNVSVTVTACCQNMWSAARGKEEIHHHGFSAAFTAKNSFRNGDVDRNILPSQFRASVAFAAKNGRDSAQRSCTDKQFVPAKDIVREASSVWIGKSTLPLPFLRPPPVRDKSLHHGPHPGLPSTRACVKLQVNECVAGC